MQTHRQRLAIVGLVLVLAGGLATAQERQVGVKAGIAVSSLEQPGSEGYDVRTGLAGGAFAVIPIHKRTAIQAEVLLIEKGGTRGLIDPAIIQGDVSEKLQFQYLDLPILLRVTGPGAGNASLHGFVGPTLSVRTSAKYQTALSGTGTFGFEYNIGEEAKRFDVGLSVGAGADIGRRLVIDARYTHGFMDVLDEDNESLRNRGFLVTAGFRIF
jgi:hypothetical protein